ncbi:MULTISPECIES: EAL domain-containing protein [Pirellulaceae]|nr:MULTISPECIES: EAL domain-containing protein [Pirellulaceae]
MHSPSVDHNFVNRDPSFDTQQLVVKGALGNVETNHSLQGWALEGCLPGHSTIAKTPLRSGLVSIGRDPQTDFPVGSPNVSKRHAQIELVNDQLRLTDLGSTNGTFVNGHRIQDTVALNELDLVQVADVELRLVKTRTAVVDRTAVETRPEHRWALSSMHKVIAGNCMATCFQPIVDAGSQHSIGFEALVRATVDGLESPMVLFDQAEKLGVEKRLSEVCRLRALETIDKANADGILFLNTHPNETLDADLLKSIQRLRENSPDRQIVIEIHEKAITHLNLLREFSAALRDLGIQLAFDDFGAGQSRLVELCQVSPDVLKFDRSLIQGLAQDDRNFKLVATLHESAKQLNIRTLAEGVEMPEEVAGCMEIGFDLFQGYAFGKPKPISEVVNQDV